MSKAIATAPGFESGAYLLSLKEILVLNSAKIGAELLRRAEDGSWPPGPQTIETGELTLESIGFSRGLPHHAPCKIKRNGVRPP